RDVPVGRLLAERLGLPVVLDNDVNALAAGEALFGRGRRAASFLVCTVGRGIGAGVVIDGRVHRGRNGGAGEIGHTLSEPGGRHCDCGRRGCLEAQASVPALLARYREAGGPGRPVSAESLAALAAAGDPLARDLISDAGRRVGLALAAAVNLLNPDLLILAGEGLALGEGLVAGARDALAAGTFPGLGVNLPLVVDPWDDREWARGAASLAAARAWQALEARA
ncbi:MAG TPA: ROK family protein, partial [Deinococcales bacterium]|nr:ROK family protein [Deinococcales bacterium]